jgi:hypothetical protein
MKEHGAALAIASFLLAAGCVSENSPNAPHDEAPVLPDTAEFSIDADWFNSQQKALDATQQNFLNAAIRVVVIKTVSDIVLTPPVAAFALALHSVPTRQPDGSWLWVYTYVYGQDEAQIRLRGEPDDYGADWEMRVTLPAAGAVNELWFEGETSRWGEEGYWLFHDFNRPDDPTVARLEWGREGSVRSVSFTDLDVNPGDRLSYREGESDRSIEFSDASEGEEWFIRWNETTGAGSLMVPDYNGGLEACWDSLRNDVDCAPAS